MKKRIISILLVLAVVFACTAVQTPEQTLAASKAKLNKTKLTLTVGDTAELELLNTTTTVTWKSSNKKVATVSKTGVVTAKKKGNTTITATTKKGTKFKCKVTVKAASAASNTKMEKAFDVLAAYLKENPEVLSVEDTESYGVYAKVEGKKIILNDMLAGEGGLFVSNEYVITRGSKVVEIKPQESTLGDLFEVKSIKFDVSKLSDTDKVFTEKDIIVLDASMESMKADIAEIYSSTFVLALIALDTSAADCGTGIDELFDMSLSD